MSDAINKAVATVKVMAKDKGLKLKCEITPEVGSVFSDQRRVEQILINLLNNAVKFTEKGDVLIKAKISNNQLIEDEEKSDTATDMSGTFNPIVCVKISDTGIGIKAEDKDKLFIPFKQIDTGLTRQYEGTGLGLSICKKLTGLLGGQISADSKGLGKGSTFTLILPTGGKTDVKDTGN